MTSFDFFGIVFQKSRSKTMYYNTQNDLALFEPRGHFTFYPCVIQAVLQVFFIAEPQGLPHI